MIRVRPSSLNTLKYCLGYLLLGERVPEIPDTIKEQEGTLAHALLKDRLTKISWNHSNYDLEMVNYVDKAARYVLKHIGTSDLVVESESEFPLIHPWCKGTPDITRMDHETGIFHVFDLKYGFVPVDVEWNWQLLVYGTRCPQGTRFVKLHIYQPRAYDGSGPVKTQVIDIQSFHQAVSYISSRVSLAVDPTKAFCSAGEHCRYCKCFASCHTIDTAIKSGFELTGKIESDENFLGMQLHLLRTITPVMVKRLERLEALIEAQIRAGKTVPNVTLQPSPGNLAWNIPESEVRALCSLFGKPSHKEKLLTPKQAIDSGVDEKTVKLWASRKSNYKSVVMTTQEVGKWLRME